MKKKTILIIDDDSNICRTLSDILTVKGYQAFSAAGGKEGIDFIKESVVNLVIIDLGLPDIPGLDVLNRVKKENPDTEAIILTGNVSIDAAIEATNLGAFSYLLKPYDLEQMLLHIRRALEKQSIAEDLRKSEKRYRLIAENTRDMIWTLDLSGRTTYVSPSVEFLRGFTPKEAMAQSLGETVSPESVNVLRADMEAVLRKGNGDSSKNTRVHEIEYLCKDGGTIWMEATSSGLYDTSETLLGVLVASRDVTERQAAEAEKNKLIAELRDAVKKIKTLTGLLPICSYCKKIRNEKEKWEHLEEYITDRSEADFSHSICPECMKRYFPDIK